MALTRCSYSPLGKLGGFAPFFSQFSAVLNGFAPFFGYFFVSFLPIQLKFPPEKLGGFAPFYPVYKKIKKDSTITLCTNNPRYPFEQNLQSLIGSKFYTSISNKGITIDSLEGINQATDNIYKNFVKLPDSIVVENTRNRIKATFGERYIKGLIEHIFSTIPESIIKKGGSWEKQNQYRCNLKSSFTTTYSIEEQDNELYRINGITSIKDSTETLFSANGITYLLGDIKGDIKINNNILKKNGLLKEGSISINLKAKATPLNIWGTTEDATAEEITIKIDHRIKENNSHF